MVLLEAQQPGRRGVSGEREEMQEGAFRLADEGKAHFRCDFKGCGEPGPTVVDEDGCCVYCGVDATVVPASPNQRTERP